MISELTVINTRLPGLLGFLRQHWPDDPDLRAVQLRVPADTYLCLLADLTPRVCAPTGDPIQAMFGLTLIVDYYLEHGAWQVCAADGTLLRDSRSPATPRRNP